ncbi:MAG TPA: FAD:protein FMN transferase [Longimicrobiales bacterium]|nr:FAD:protein FMN transferase [Longimicrobiales bacterium]
MTERDGGRPSRREFLALGAGAFVVAAMPGVIRPKRRLVRRAVPTMGTIAEIGVVHRDERFAQAAIAAAIGELRAVDRTMTRFDAASDVGRANREAARGPVPVSGATADVVAAALVWADASSGAFDPTLGRAVELWDVGRRRTPPRTAELRAFAGARLYRQLELGERAGSPVVVYRDPGVALDLGGIAKGYGVDRAVRSLREWGITDALVNVGGDLYAMGVAADGDAWEVGVRDPDDASRVAVRFRMSDRAVATSGDYAQYFEHGGRRYHHLLDPRTGEPRRGATRSVTVAADRCMTADAAGTAVFGEGAEAARRVIARVDRGAEILHVG